jgi:anti-sigma regulatory factor (Ser/Thr protein kinase)
VEHDSDTYTVQSATKNFAMRVGFSRIAATELAIVASELTSNVLKYGVKGSLVLERVDDPARGVRVTAFDEGPPFASFETALRDDSDDQGPLSPAAYGRRRGIGRGLGAVSRLSDACGWEPEARGKRVWAVRYLQRGPRS